MRRRTFLGGSALTVFAMSNAVTSAADQSIDGYHMPSEEGPHERTFMQWPVSRQVYYSNRQLENVQKTIADVANTISEFEPIVMLMDAQHQKRARRLLSSDVEIWNVPTEDLWCRDSGPVFVMNSQGDQAISNLNFNGWGNKQVHKDDGQIADRVGEILEIPVFNNGIVGEAGGIESNGAGTLIAHESSWINPNRNRFGKQEVATKLKQALGAEQVIWAPGISGLDITDYHIDALARFTDETTILIQLPDRIFAGDPWSRAAFETRDILAKAEDLDGNRFSIVEIPEPTKPRNKHADFVASYVNYYVCNGAVICAEFGDREADSIAINQLTRLFPDREIIAINADELGKLGGGIHCATQQQPASV
ncbi:MAG: agmatine deiminase family protein [Pseudomonadota bacterium]